METKEVTENFVKSQHEPFAIVKDHSADCYRIVIGNYLASTHKFAGVKQAENYISRKPWELILNAMSILIETNKTHLQNENS